VWNGTCESDAFYWRKYAVHMVSTLLVTGETATSHCFLRRTLEEFRVKSKQKEKKEVAFSNFPKISRGRQKKNVLQF
jgi:hypothetical protein